MKVAINETQQTVTFTFEGLDPVIFDAEKAHDDIRAYAMLHGFQARIRDAAALDRSKVEGGVVTEEMRRAEVVAMSNHLATSATWNMKAAAVPKQNATIAAIAAKMGTTYAEAEAEVARRMLAELA